MTMCCFADVLYVATCNPVALYSMKENGDKIQYVDLYDVFPRTISGVWQPCITIAPLGSPLDGQVVLHEEQVGTQPKTISYSCINWVHHITFTHPLLVTKSAHAWPPKGTLIGLHPALSVY